MVATNSAPNFDLEDFFWVRKSTNYIKCQLGPKNGGFIIFLRFINQWPNPLGEASVFKNPPQYILIMSSGLSVSHTSKDMYINAHLKVSWFYLSFLFLYKDCLIFANCILMLSNSSATNLRFHPYFYFIFVALYEL